ncbi:MAG: murein biosynthesis integral membrane protein MurJ [Anaerolineales bacterium]
MDETAALEERTIARAAGVVMAGFILSNLTGLAKWVLVSRAFGTSAQLDAFNAANRLPELLFSVMAGGALASAFVPTFTSFITRDDRPGAWRLASAIANLVFLTMSAAAALAWLAAPWLVPHILAPGFAPAETQLTISLLRILLLSAVIFGMSGLLMGILNAHQHFLLPALAPTFLWLGWIVGVLFFVPAIGVYGLAWGVVLGAAMHLLVQLPGLRGRGGRYQFVLDLGNQAVRQVGRLMAPRLVGQAIVQLNFLVNVILASSMAEGSLAAINYAFFIMLMPQAIIAQAIAIAALPTFSAQAASGAFDRMRTSLAATLRGVLFLALPASLGLILLRRPIVAMLFQRGAFDVRSTDLVAWPLLWYAAGLVGHSLVEIVARAFYALQDTKTPVFLGTAAMTLNVVLSLALAALFRRWGLPPHGGLALANSIATAIEAGGLLILMQRRLGGLAFKRIRRGLAVTVIATGLMSVALALWLRWQPMASPWLLGGGGALLGGALFWAAATALGAPETRQLPSMMIQWIKERRSRSTPRP